MPNFKHALRGIRVFLVTTMNARIHLFCAAVVIGAGYYFKISAVEWLSLVLSIGLVFSAEAFNTAIEIDINLTSPEYHPYARDTKDVAAGAVLLASIIAIVIGLIIFLPRLLWIL